MVREPLHRDQADGQSAEDEDESNADGNQTP
jgi:hypothetical protein